jgi:hypothetical protein
MVCFWMVMVVWGLMCLAPVAHDWGRRNGV